MPRRCRPMCASRTFRCSTARCRASRAPTSRRSVSRATPRRAPGRTTWRYLFDRFIDDDGESDKARAEKRCTPTAQTAMPKRTDIKSILIIGAGPIVIGQACEFDYSGAQACKALREEGYRVILVNSNPATIMTDPDMADVDLHRADHLADGREDHRQGAPRCAPADHGRADRAELRARSGQARRAGKIQRRDDRRLAGGHRQGRGPREIQAGDDQDRPRLGAFGHRAQHGRSAAGAGGARLSGHHPPVLHPGRLAAAASPTTAKNSSRSASAASKPSPTQRTADRGIAARLERIRDGSGARPQATTASSSARSRTSIRWACIPATRSPWRRRRR